MGHLFSCLNGRQLVISNRKDFLADLSEYEVLPGAVLLSAWKIENGSLSLWKSVVEELLRLGCSYFVCAGDFAEELHDLIDDIVFSQIHDGSVATTFHNGESPEDVINFFVYTTSLQVKSNMALLAILDSNSPQDLIMINLLEQQ